ncbi:MAG: pyruvate dehydrogenase (acetyl-transferring) E1 component subunit alpha, partial [Streptomyces sp.]|nr:pyruvate dehydrogenase (acetyl-transferring) E1 component subunit alpha [Streptomyces sp.]
MTVESTAARKPRRSAGTKSTAGKTTTARKSPSTDPELVQLLTPEGERVKNAEYDEYVAGITPDELRGLYRDMVLTRRFDAEATSLQRQGELGLWAS